MLIMQMFRIPLQCLQNDLQKPLVLKSDLNSTILTVNCTTIYFVLLYVLLSNHLAFTMDLIYFHRYALIKKDSLYRGWRTTLFNRGYPCVNEHSNWNLSFWNGNTCSSRQIQMVHFLWRWSDGFSTEGTFSETNCSQQTCGLEDGFAFETASWVGATDQFQGVSSNPLWKQPACTSDGLYAFCLFFFLMFFCFTCSFQTNPATMWYRSNSTINFSI